MDDARPVSSVTTAADEQRGWIVTIASMIALIPSSSSIMLSSQGFYIGPVTEEFGWSRARYMAPISAAQMLLAIGTPFAGYLGDRWGIRPLLLGGIVVFGVMTMILGVIDGNFLTYVIVTLAVWFGGTAQTSLFYAKAIATWFVRNRGLALAVGTVGVPLGQFLCQPLIAWLVTNFGWREARIITGALVLFVALPCAWRFVHERPGGGTQAGAETRLSSLLRNRTFLLLAALFFFGGVALIGLLIQIVPVITERGVSLSLAAAGLSMLALIQIAARLGSGFLLDRVETPRVVIIWFVIGILGFLMLSVANGNGLVILAMMLIGAAMGAEMEVAAYFAVRYFGLAGYGGVFGMLTSAYAVGAAIGGFAMSMSRDITGSYTAALHIGVLALVFSSAVTALLPPYPKTKAQF